MITIKSIFRNRLKPRKNKKFIKAVKAKFPDLDLDHLTESVYGMKLNDYLLYPRNHQEHINKHYKRDDTEEEFIEHLIKSMEIIFDILDEVIK